MIVAVLTAGVAAQVPLMPSHERARPDREAATTVIARVNGVAIGRAELEAAMQARLPLASYHRNIPPEKIEAVRREALDGLIDEELRYQEAVRLKTRVPPREVDEALARARSTFRGGPEAFERERRASGTTLPQLRSGILRGLMIRKAYDQAVTRSCGVTEQDAAAYYDTNRARFIVPEQLRPYLITVGVPPAAPQQEWARAREKTADLARQIAAGASFEAIARQHSSDPTRERGGDLGFVHRGQLIEDFESALKTLRPGQMSGTIQTIYGFHLLRLAEIRPPAQKSFTDVKDQLIRDLTEKRCSEAADRWSKQLRATARIEIVDDKPQPVRAARNAGPS